MKQIETDKSKFFALYWGQEIHRAPCFDKDYGEEVLIDVSPYRAHYDGSASDMYNEWLELTSIENITDDHVREISKMPCYAFEEGTDGSIDEFKNFIIYGHDLNNLPSIVVDYLRLEGYAVNWNGYIVEQMIENGWIKIKK